MKSAYMCKDCCEINPHKGPYENCLSCGSQRVFEGEADEYKGELVINGDTRFKVAQLNYELDHMFRGNNLDEILDIAKRAKEIRKDWGYV